MISRAEALRAAAPETFLAEARQIVDSEPVLRIFAACEWEELDENGQLWIAAIVRETLARASEST